MLFFRRRNIAALLAAMAVGLAASLVAASGANAQGARTESRPTARPWDDRVKKFYDRGDPQHRLDAEKRRIYGDPKRLYDDPLRRLNREPLRRLGLPENRLTAPHAPARARESAPATFDFRTSRLDRNRDGAISRAEYFQGQTRAVTPGFRGERLRERARDRLDSQFRNADRNRDGVVTPAELDGVARF